MTVTDYIPWACLLIISGGLMAIAWRALTIAHDLARLALQGGVAAPTPSPAKVAPAPVPVPPPVPASPALPPIDDPIIDDAFVDFLKRQEGFVAKAKWDYKQYTNGYGTRALSASEVIDEAEALRRLRVEAQAAAAHVREFAPGLAKGPTQALIDLTFNAGPGWEHEHLGAAVKAGDLAKAKEYLQQYVHAGGQVLDALVKRRAADVAMFDHPL